MKYQTDVTIEGVVSELERPLESAVSFYLVHTLLFLNDGSGGRDIKILVVHVGKRNDKIENGRRVTVRGYITQSSNEHIYIHANSIIVEPKEKHIKP